MNPKNKLVIIAGATGSVGQEVLRQTITDSGTLVYGISRRGLSIQKMESLPLYNTIINIDLTQETSIEEFISKLPHQKFKEIYYYHLVGEFKTEISSDFTIAVANDYDNDGIDDEVYSLVAKSYIQMTRGLTIFASQNNSILNIISIGSLTDIYTIPCFQSFAKSRKIVRDFSKKTQQENNHVSFYLFNTSTILSTDELLERPYLFTTDVNPNYWITPSELTHRMLGLVTSAKGYVEKDIYVSNPNFSDNYFNAEITFRRRVQELYGKTI